MEKDVLVKIIEDTFIRSNPLTAILRLNKAGKALSCDYI
jgi:hypothetical protein